MIGRAFPPASNVREDGPLSESESTDQQTADILKVCKREHERGVAYWQPVQEAILEERSFIDGQHYDDDVDPHELRSEGLRFVGQETWNVIRHKVAQMTDSPRTIEARPVDRFSDPDDAEVAASLLEWETGHPQKSFDDCSDLMAQAAVSARIGIIWIDWDPEMGQFGEILFRPGDAAHTMWEPGFHDPHDLRCNWMNDEVVMSIADLREALKGNRYASQEALDALKPEEGLTVNQGSSSGALGRHDSSTTMGNRVRDVGPDQPHDAVLVRRWWFKNDRTTASKSRLRDTLTLKPAQRYMVCGMPGAPGCGWKSPTQGELGTTLPEDEPAAPDNPLASADSQPGDGCPRCGGPLMRVDQRVPQDDMLVYPKGKRMVWETPNQPQQSEPLYDGPWPTMVLNPQSDVRSFPVYVMTCYLPSDPTKPTGPSDTSLNWSAQAASDYLMTKAFRAAAQYQRYYVMPNTGLEDYQGIEFRFRDDQFNVMYRNPDTLKAFNPGEERQVQVLDGSQFDPSLPAYWGMVQQVLNGKQGIADFGFTPQNSKDIPATTIAQLTQQADIPAEHLKRRFHRALSKGHGPLWDYIRATYTPARMRRLKLGDDPNQVLQVRGDELPNFDFVISDTPPFSGLEKAKSEALDKLIAVPPEWQDIYADVNNLPPSILRKVKQRQQQIAAAAANAPPVGGGTPGQPGQAGAPQEAASPGPIPPPMSGAAPAQMAGAMQTNGNAAMLSGVGA